MSETVQADDGTMLPLNDLNNTLEFSGAFISRITVFYRKNTYEQIFINDGTNITNISSWQLVIPGQAYMLAEGGEYMLDENGSFMVTS